MGRTRHQKFQVESYLQAALKACEINIIIVLDNKHKLQKEIKVKTAKIVIINSKIIKTLCMTNGLDS